MAPVRWASRRRRPSSSNSSGVVLPLRRLHPSAFAHFGRLAWMLWQGGKRVIGEARAVNRHPC